ncbi:MAG: helix-turn-helix transcriptional regulator [Planctomycetota bacterium]|jgi:YesN/AraC family two-component response regulator
MEAIRAGFNHVIDRGRLVGEQGRDYVDTHFHLKITRKSAADALGISQDYVTKLFREKGEKSFNDYLEGLRLAKATNLLKHSSLQIQDIAEACGFASGNYFTKVFKRITGHPPRRPPQKAGNDQSTNIACIGNRWLC